VPLPIRTFRQAFDFGLGLRLYCPGCHDWRPVDLKAEQLDLPFAGGPRFVCKHLKLKVYGEGREVCGSIGEPLFNPVRRRSRSRHGRRAMLWRRQAPALGDRWHRHQGGALGWPAGCPH
jgi:hypothetical protein